ncbi:Pc21g07980 [Penicillium rubens Wisconsin 54-1255]|uniref:Pc21g07980 protein n=1 Tax=Penicillium rubens (strain ATCC 28089 / DSM 1075 / NRRL 1951 / Wisconsin 54-1255) TaxID=500485 RepID=B6HL92_PENRW|nr:Pc21g07980 [Penicillium rubens Wisconsin 54-1255]
MPYNCSGPQPPISVDPDITGKGVIANYVATAGIAVLLIIIHFFVVYEPALDPFRKTDYPLNQSFRPNPIDTIILRTVRRIPKRLMGARKVRVNSQVGKGFTECILAMSDLQIVTGLSILISGYTQLPQGLSSFHWMVIVDLAWFSSLTHLACLTLLRNHLYNHSMQRIWRLLCMAVLVILLTVALSFTGGYDWTSSHRSNYIYKGTAFNVIRPAMCHPSSSTRSSVTYYAMVFSILLVVFGFVARIIRLHKAISVGVWGKSRAKLSIQARRLLSIAFAWSCLGSSHKSLKRTLFYRPLLTTLFVAHLFLDGWSSMFVEDVHEGSTVLRFTMLQESDEREAGWGFGQVMAVVLLLAPLITIVKYFTHDDEQPGIVTSCSHHIYELSHIESQSMSPNTSSTHETSRRPDDPNSNLDDHVQTIGAVILYFMLICVVMLILICLTSYTANLLNGLQAFYIPIAVALVGIWGVALFSLTIELDLSHMSLWFQRFLHMVNVAFFIINAFLVFLQDRLPKSYLLASIEICSMWVFAAVFYILCAVFYRIYGTS